MRASEQRPSIFKVAARFAKIGAVDCYTRVEDCRARGQQVAADVRGLQRRGRIGPSERSPHEPRRKREQNSDRNAK